MDDNKRTPDDSYKDLLDIYAREEDEQKNPSLKIWLRETVRAAKSHLSLK